MTPPKCPYCGGELHGEAAIPPMSQRQLRIYKSVVAAGSEGIAMNDLIPRMYADNQWPTPGAWTVLRVQVHAINRLIGNLNQRISGNKRGAYRLVRINDEAQSQDESTSQSHHRHSGSQ